MPRLRVRDLVYHGRRLAALDVAPGECVCVVGPSGSGKTLLLRSLADLDPHEGSVALDDTECGGIAAPQWRRTVGLLPAESQWWYDTVGEHFPDGAPAYLDALGFADDPLPWQIARLSTGERQRLALARLLTNEPQALLLDEPTAALDAENVARVEDLIATYRRERSAPVLWVSHDARQVERIADRVLHVNSGSVTAEGGA